MRQFDATAPTAATAATLSNMSPSRPAAAFGTGAGARAQGGAFASTFQQVQHDVNAYIAGGDGGLASASPHGAPPSGAASALSLQGMALRQRAGGAIGGLDGLGGLHNGSGADSDIQQQFLASIQPWAEETAGKLGVSPQIVAAHAALESGWGQRPLRQGAVDSNNLFGLKAGAGWQGAVASATTTEYEHGATLKKVERFRSYPDTASAFRDYADMLTSNPRYQGALHTGADARAFAQGLAQGGYATDPAYADKLSNLARQLQRSGFSAPARAGAVTPLGD